MYESMRRCWKEDLSILGGWFGVGYGEGLGGANARRRALQDLAAALEDEMMKSGDVEVERKQSLCIMKL